MRLKNALALASAALAAATVAALVLVGSPDAGAAVAPSATSVLLSQGQPVTASSSGGCCPAVDAVDGSTTTRWASTANIDPSWIYVDLGAMAQITEVKL